MRPFLAVLLLSFSCSATNLITLATITWTNLDGSKAIAVVARQDVGSIQAPIYKTTLYYSFCLVPVSQCFTGYGTIPNAAFKGSVSQSYTKADVVTLALDTSTVPGYVNAICYAPDADANCTGGEYLTTGGWFGLQFTKTPYVANMDSTASTAIDSGNKSQSTSFLGTYSANCLGTVLGYSLSLYNTEFYQTKMSYSAGTYSSTALTTALAKFLPETTVNQIHTLEKKNAKHITF